MAIGFWLLPGEVVAGRGTNAGSFPLKLPNPAVRTILLSSREVLSRITIGE